MMAVLVWWKTVTSAYDLIAQINANSFQIMQNYPNPFSHNTMIPITIEKERVVSISVYDLLGNKINTIYEGVLPKGSHEFQFTPRNLNDGIYLYGIESENKRIVKKMVYRVWD